MTATNGLVLVVDDDPGLRSVLRDVLSDNGYQVIEAENGHKARALLADHQPDVILLDLGLPDVSGLDLLRDLIEGCPSPVIVVSGRSGETDTVVGLDLGADDYITKPFSERELIARINATTRRARKHRAKPKLSFGSLIIDENAHEVMVDGNTVNLTPKEFDVLDFLARSPRHVYNRQQLLQHVWGSSSNWQDDNTVAEHVHRIRRKLDPANRSRWIETVRGVGYRFARSAD
jgi:two-component system, OmpR family, phosphate regulon response regulator PhoB